METTSRIRLLWQKVRKNKCLTCVVMPYRHYATADYTELFSYNLQFHKFKYKTALTILHIISIIEIKWLLIIKKEVLLILYSSVMCGIFV